MAYNKYFRGTGPGWNVEKLKIELQAALGQAVAAVVSEDGQTLEIEYTVPSAETVINQVVMQHIATLAFTIQTPDGQQFTNYGSFFYGTGSIDGGDATGIWGGFPAIEYPTGSGTSYVFMTLNAGTLQTGITNAGVQVGGGGAVSIDASGITIAAGPDPVNSVTWRAVSPSYNPVDIGGDTIGTTPNRSALLNIRALGESGGSGTAAIWLTAAGGDGLVRQLALQNASPFLTLSTIPGDVTKVSAGDPYVAVHIANSVTKTTIYSKDIYGGTLGPNGNFTVRIPFIYLNNSGGGRTITWQVDLGATTDIFNVATGSLGASANRRSGFVELEIANNAATNAQNMILRWNIPTVGASNTAQPDTGSEGMAAWAQPAVDTTVLNTLVIYATLSAATATQNFDTLGAHADGPNYGA